MEGDFAEKKVSKAMDTSKLLAGVVVFTVFAASGCSGSRLNFSKPGISQQQYDQDRFECMKAAQEPVLVTAISGMPAGGMVQNNEMYLACFRAKGYTVQGEEEWEQAQAADERKGRLRQISEGQGRERQLQAELVQREYQYLIAEKRRLDQQQKNIDSEPDSVQHQQTITEHNRQIAEYNARRASYEGEERLRKWREP